MNTKATAFGLWIALIACAPPLFAQEEEIEKDLLTFRARAGLQWNDNVHLAKFGKEWDVFFSLFPEGVLNMATRFGEVVVSYTPQFILPFRAFGDSQARRILHKGHVSLSTELASGTSLALFDDLQAIPNSFGSPDNNTSTLVQTNYVRFEPAQKLELGSRTELEAKGFVARFDSSGGGANRIDYGGILDVHYAAHPRLTITVGGEGTRQQFSSTLLRDLWRLGYAVEPEFDATARLHLGARFGQQWLRFDGGGTDRDFQIEGTAKYEIVEDSKLEVTYNQAYLTNAAGDPFGVQSLSFKGGYPLGERLKVDLQVMYGRYSQVSPDPVTGAARLQPDTLLSIRPGVWYNTSERLAFEFRYSVSLNRGEITINDFFQNIVSLEATYTF